MMDRREILKMGLVGTAGYVVGQVIGPVFADPPPPIVACDFKVAGHVPGGFTVPAGQTWRIEGLATTDGNVIVNGTLAMRAGDTLRFLGIDETTVVGGDTAPLATDVGLWVEGAGQLDIQGTPKEGWNSTGSHPSWLPGDDVRLTPHAIGDYQTFATYIDGSDTVPSEVLNLTRDVVIEGQPDAKAHIRVSSTSPQIVKHALLRYLGPDRVDISSNLVGIAGRNPLHFHKCYEGSRGSVVTGVVIRDSHAAFVSHQSHGITYTDCIAFDNYGDAFGWPSRETSNDIVYDRCVAAKLKVQPSYRGYRLTGFKMSSGAGNRCVNCLAIGVLGNSQASGFEWPEGGTGVWVFTDNVAHNNRINGLFAWQNDSLPHLIERFTARRNGCSGIDHGAYRNAFTYRDISLQENGTENIKLHSLGSTTFEDVTVTGSAPSLRSVKHTLASTAPTRFIDSLFDSVVIDDSSGQPSFIDFIRCGLEPSDFVILKFNNGGRIRVQRDDGTAYQINPDGSVSALIAFQVGE